MCKHSEIDKIDEKRSYCKDCGEEFGEEQARVEIFKKKGDKVPFKIVQCKPNDVPDSADSADIDENEEKTVEVYEMFLDDPLQKVHALKFIKHHEVKK